jgi:hypothetical protein
VKSLSKIKNCKHYSDLSEHDSRFSGSGTVLFYAHLQDWEAALPDLPGGSLTDKGALTVVLTEEQYQAAKQAGCVP